MIIGTLSSLLENGGSALLNRGGDSQTFLNGGSVEAYQVNLAELFDRNFSVQEHLGHPMALQR
jgi:hypothetical protein